MIFAWLNNGGMKIMLNGVVGGSITNPAVEERLIETYVDEKRTVSPQLVKSLHENFPNISVKWNIQTQISIMWCDVVLLLLLFLLLLLLFELLLHSFLIYWNCWNCCCCSCCSQLVSVCSYDFITTVMIAISRVSITTTTYHK